MQTPEATFWRRRARWTAWRHNAGCVLAGFLPLSLGVSAVFACALLVAREHGVTTGARIWTGYALALAIGVGVAWWCSRTKFFTIPDALVRLEWHLGLHNRLSAAAAGVGQFPAAQDAPDGYSFHWRKLAPPLAGAAVLVAAAAWIPVSKSGAASVPAAPVAWTQTAEWIDALKKTDTLADPELEDVRERLEQLQKQPAQDWYSQSSLEAGDNLREQTAQSIQSLQRDLQSALSSMEAMQRFTDNTSAAEMKGVHENLANALKGLELGNLPLNSEMLGHLKQADLSKLKNLTPAQLAELKRRLAAGDKVCAACLHPGMSNGLAVASSKVQPFGRPSRDPNESSAPLTLNQKPTELGTTKAEPVSNDNLEHALPGDLMGVGKGEHRVDPAAYAGPTSAGSVASQGEGGEAVWRNDLTPKEREVVKRFFK